jgi:hypothetical protein
MCLGGSSRNQAGNERHDGNRSTGAGQENDIQRPVERFTNSLPMRCSMEGKILFDILPIRAEKYQQTGYQFKDFGSYN